MGRKCVWLIVSVLVLASFASMAGGQTVYVNFQQVASETPEGYLGDGGEVFGDRGNGWTYGWDRDITGDARDRGSSAAEDQRWDTLNHLQKASPPAVWEIVIENGLYNIYMVCGDPDNSDQTDTMLVEGVTLEDPDGQDNWDEYEVTVEVTDGRLTITADADAGASNAKIAFVHIILAIAPESARNPSPEKEATDVLRDLTISWEPGEEVTAHDVYLGTSFEDVNNASRSNPMDVLVSQGQNGTALDAGRLEFNQTYYWRIDEVLTDGSIYKGDVWSFTTEPYVYAVENIIATASVAADEGLGIENTVDGSGLNEDLQHSTASADMWMAKTDGSEAISLQYEFDKAYKLNEMLVWNYNVEFEPVLGFGLKDVTIEYSADGETWTSLGDIELAQAAADESYVANTTIDFGGAAVKYVKVTVNSNYNGNVLTQYGLSEVRFMYVPANARGPEPADGDADVSVEAVLSWRAGREAASHDVYFGTDAEALALAGNVGEASFLPGTLDLSTMYYWKVDEVNEAEAITLWEGSVWSFTTEGYLVVDDFETYNDEDNVIYESWIDGWTNDNGSTVGHLVEPFAETTTVHGGSQAMPLFYDNDGYTYAEAELDLSQDWTASGIASLSLYVYGAADNTGELYVKINGTQIACDCDITSEAWQGCTIDLSTVGANLSSVTSLAIGVEGSGATGVVYVDDIRLYPSVANAAGDDITGPGDTVVGVPNDGDWPAAETPELAIDDDTSTKYLHFKGETESTGFQITPSVGATIVAGLTFTTANDAVERDPTSFELYGSNDSIDGPYTLIASGDIVDFAGDTAWERYTKTTTPITFNNDVAYAHYQILFPTVRDASSANSMQIGEVEFLGAVAQ